MQQPVKRGFTLIELLVVIAIISLLVSILLPSLQQARDLARSTYCISNLHHIGVAVETYAAEFNGFYPPAGAYRLAGVPGTWTQLAGNIWGWDMLLRRYLGRNSGDNATDPLPMLQCPFDVGERLSSVQSSRFMSYSMNDGQGLTGSIGGTSYNLGFLVPRKIDNFRFYPGSADHCYNAPADLINIVDSHWWFSQSSVWASRYTQHYNDDVNYYSYHDDGTTANALFFDAHAEKQMRAVDLATRSGRVFYTFTGPLPW